MNVLFSFFKAEFQTNFCVSNLHVQRRIFEALSLSKGSLKQINSEFANRGISIAKDFQ